MPPIVAQSPPIESTSTLLNGHSIEHKPSSSAPAYDFEPLWLRDTQPNYIDSQATAIPQSLPTQTITQSLQNYDSFIIVVTICFIIYCRILKTGKSFLKENIRTLLTFQAKKDTFNQNTIKEVWAGFFLCLVPLFLTSAVIYQFFRQHLPLPHTPAQSWLIITAFTLIIAQFFIIKHLLYSLIGYVFNIKTHTQPLQKAGLSMLETLGILIFIPCVVYIFNSSHPIIALYTIGILFISTQLLLLSRVISFFMSQKTHFLIGIVYLCTVETIPYIFIAKGLYVLYEKYLFV